MMVAHLQVPFRYSILRESHDISSMPSTVSKTYWHSHAYIAAATSEDTA
jgi:hypothetical protein